MTEREVLFNHGEIIAKLSLLFEPPTRGEIRAAPTVVRGSTGLTMREVG